MNLNAIAGPIVAVVQPTEIVSLQISTGYTENNDGLQVPVYATPVDVSMSIQSASNDDLRQLEGVNQQGINEVVYLNGRMDGIVRDEEKGGDLITKRDGTVWLVVQILEHWTQASVVIWCKAAIKRQLTPT